MQQLSLFNIPHALILQFLRAILEISNPNNTILQNVAADRQRSARDEASFACVALFIFIAFVCVARVGRQYNSGHFAPGLKLIATALKNAKRRLVYLSDFISLSARFVFEQAENNKFPLLCG